MSVISLQKGQKIDLTKGNAGLSQVIVGLGWDPIKNGGKGFFSGLLGSKGADIDCDASAILLDANGRLVRKENVVYFGNLKSICKSVIHTGDNLTGDGEGDDEQIQVNLSQIPVDVHKIVFVVNIYQCTARKQNFGMIQNCFIRIFDPENRNKELCQYNLTDNYSGMTALIVGEIYRYNGEWKFAAIGEGTKDTSITELVSRYY